MYRTHDNNQNVNEAGGIINTFYLSKFFDKESLLDTIYALKTKAEIDDKDYRMWFKLNENTKISVITSVRESNQATVVDSIGQGSFGAALASSLNIGWAIQDTFSEVRSSSIGTLLLNSLVMQDDVSKMNDNLSQARSG